MKESDDLMIANFVYTLTNYGKLCKYDLDNAFNFFLLIEEYEKCSVLKEIINRKYYDNNKKSNYVSISSILNMINKFDDVTNEMFQYKIKLLKLKSELYDSIGEIEKNIKKR